MIILILVIVLPYYFPESFYFVQIFWECLPPLPHKSQKPEAPNWPFFGSTLNAHNAALTNNYSIQSSTMTGNKPGSHKKTNITRKVVVSEERVKKKLRLSELPVLGTTVSPVVVTQPSQADSQQPTVANGIDSVARVPTGSPIADHGAIVEMTAGVPSNCVPSLSEGMIYGQGRLELFSRGCQEC